VEKGGQNLQTIKEYGDVDLYVDWCVEQGADSGVYLKNAPQIQIWFNPLGSGGLFNNKAGARNPLVVADNPADHWNTFHIVQRQHDMTTVWLNGQLVVDNVKMENYWDYSKPLPAKGNIELQFHGHKLYWKNIYLKELK
jgi:3-keto-disaccharide hydrolase